MNTFKESKTRALDKWQPCKALWVGSGNQLCREITTNKYKTEICLCIAAAATCIVYCMNQKNLKVKREYEKKRLNSDFSKIRLLGPLSLCTLPAFHIAKE